MKERPPFCHKRVTKCVTKCVTKWVKKCVTSVSQSVSHKLTRTAKNWTQIHYMGRFFLTLSLPLLLVLCHFNLTEKRPLEIEHKLITWAVFPWLFSFFSYYLVLYHFHLTEKRTAKNWTQTYYMNGFSLTLFLLLLYHFLLTEKGPLKIGHKVITWMVFPWLFFFYCIPLPLYKSKTAKNWTQIYYMLQYKNCPFSTALSKKKNLNSLRFAAFGGSAPLEKMSMRSMNHDV